MSQTLLDQPPQKKEPMLLLDRTGSMQYPASVNGTTPRHAVLREALGLLVERLGAQDSAGKQEQGGGGLRTITFAGGAAEDIGDLNSQNLAELWRHIHWSGSTWIKPGFDALCDAYTEEFGSLPQDQRPECLALIITDGEAEDTDTFAEALSRAHNNLYVEVVLLGYGAEHKAALAAYKKVAETNHHVKVTAMDGETNPEVIARELIRMVE